MFKGGKMKKKKRKTEGQFNKGSVGFIGEKVFSEYAQLC